MVKSIVTVVGHDKVGIIANVCSLLSSHQVNVLDISQTVLQDYFTMIMVVDTSACSMDFAALVTELEQEGTKLGLTIHAQREDIFNAMHRI